MLMASFCLPDPAELDDAISSGGETEIALHHISAVCCGPKAG